MAMKHWTHENEFRQVMWNLEEEIRDDASLLEDSVHVFNSNDDPAVFFQFNTQREDTRDPLTLTFETAKDPYDEVPGDSVEFNVFDSENPDSHEVVRKLAVTKREVDGFEIYTVDAQDVLAMLKEWLAFKDA